MRAAACVQLCQSATFWRGSCCRRAQLEASGPESVRRLFPSSRALLHTHSPPLWNPAINVSCLNANMIKIAHANYSLSHAVGVKLREWERLMDKGSVMFETDYTLFVGKKHSDVNDLPLPALKNTILLFFFLLGKS